MRVEFNSIKCGRNATVDSVVALVSHLIQNWWPAKIVLNSEYSIWRTNMLSDERLKFCQKLSASGTGKIKLTMRQYVHWDKNGQVSSFSLAEPTLRMLNTFSFHVWIGAAFLSDNATRPVERAAEMRQPIQTSNLIRFVELNSTRQICDA